MFGTYEKFNLIRAAYTRAEAVQYFFEDYYKPGTLRFGGNRSGESSSTTDFLFDINLTKEGVPIDYTYFADEGSLRISAGYADVEFAITNRSHMRVRGDCAGFKLKLVLRSAMGDSARGCRGMYALPDGSGWEADFGTNGRLQFKMLSGSFLASSTYDDEAKAYSYVAFDFLPDAETGSFDAAIHEYIGDEPAPHGEYEPFDDIVGGNKADFAEFSKKYRPAAKGYEELSEYARWVIWSHKTGVTEGLVEPMILFQNAMAVMAASWQQSYNAMPMLNDPDEAWRLICTMLNYQDDRTGRIAGMLTYKGGNAGQQPPFQGFALDFLLRSIGDDFLTPKRCEEMYPKFANWANFWTTYRSAGRGDDVTVMHSPHDSGWDDASNFQDGFPASDPNNMVFLILLMESIAKLAEGCGKTDEAKQWLARSEKLTKIIIDEYWDGEKFATKVKGKNVDSLSLSCYQPIILGKRLPQEIIDKVTEKLMEEGHFLTEIGLASESMKSKHVTFGISFVCGRVVGPQNMILTVGLQAAGKQKEADIIARRFCDHAKREGIILGYAPYDYFPLTGEKAEDQPTPHMTDGWPWSSWSANCVLTMIGSIIGK
ncbi:MAG: hypothetical protein FWB97_09795 [Oscillospiraceae bacterium]|nr:hypothetical protein [Oscillospiraceae bacterium]